MKTSSTWVVIEAGIFSTIGLIVNLTVDRDNVFDITTSGLFLITLILASVAAYLGERDISILESKRIAQQGPVAKTVS